MIARIYLSIGPVQGFVSQSRRTRDLWGSSWLLAFLSAHAMRGAVTAGGRLVRPDVRVVERDRLYRWVSGHRDGEPPSIGSLPNRFVVEVDGAVPASAPGCDPSRHLLPVRCLEAGVRRRLAHIRSAGMPRRGRDRSHLGPTGAQVLGDHVDRR